MSKEAMKLALEALKNSVDLVSNDAREAEKMYANVPTRLARVQGLVALEVAHEKAITALQKLLADNALDKKAENARELGLDYEPEQEPAQQPAVPDAIHHTDLSETLEYIQGWNDCRQAMLRTRGTT